MPRLASLLPFALISLAAACAAGGAGEPLTDARDAFGLHQGDPEREIAAFDATADAAADVDAALAAAEARGTLALLVFGANWCHDSRGLAWRFAQPEIAPLIEENYELVYVDVGFLDQNLELARRFGVSELEGTPTVLVVAPGGELLNAASVSAWRTASSRSLEETSAYFSQWARP